MKHKITIAGAAVLMALSWVTSVAGDAKAYEAACAAAEEARKASAELKYEWNTIAPLIDKAKAAAEEGEFDKAAKLCEEARLHGEAAIEQAKTQAEFWKVAVVK